ncbi:50S ribosomal protein L23 [candidate division TM6 bacterium RIFCSPHIGHO2_12_FULL_38_8]|nr:MAG: 50S ribosomal protein L23 [candidate division TM6 bacterium RIFCSPHIGHO2_12_FULL_38_8]
MELSIYDIIVGPIVSNKAYRLHQTLKKITLQVHPQSNKTLIAQAMHKLFNVEVESVRVMVRKGKRKISKTRNVSVDNLRKIAIVTLKKGQDMNLFTDAPVSMNPTNASQSTNVAAK